MSNEFDDWAVAAAGELASHVERHGLVCTWSEAHERLLNEAGRGPHRLMIPAEERTLVDDDDEVFEDETGELCVAFRSPLSWRHPDFVECAAATHLHWHGRAYHPTNPAHSVVPVAIPLVAIAEAVHRLNFLLHAYLQSPADHPGRDRLAEVSRVATCLSASLQDEVEWVVAQRGLDEELIDSSDIVLCQASHVFAAARLLSEGRAVASSTAEGDVEWMPFPRDRETLRDPMHIDCCIRSLRWWIGVDWTIASDADHQSL